MMNLQRVWQNVRVCVTVWVCERVHVYVFFVAWFMIITVYPNVGADERQQLFHLFILFFLQWEVNFQWKFVTSSQTRFLPHSITGSCSPSHLNTHTCAHIDLPTCTINLKGITKVRAASLRTLTLLLWSLLPCITTSSYPSPSFSIRHCHQLSHDASTQRHTDTPGSIIYLLNL